MLKFSFDSFQPMKLMKSLLAFAICAFMFLPMSIQAQDTFDIHNYDIHMKVNEDGTLNITEVIDLEYDQYVHGFYRNIPVKYEMDWGEQGKRTYWFPVYDIDVMNDPYEVDDDSDGVQIKIGDPNEYVYGEKRYVISYTVQMRDLGLNQDYFYFNLIGNSFDCRIEHVDFTIEMPKSFSTEGLDFYNANVVYTVNDHIISGSTQETLYNYQGLTIYLPLGQNYFKFVPIKDYSLLMMGIGAALLIFSFFLYFRFSKKKPCVVTVEFTAPEGMSSASVGYIVDGVVNNEDVLSLIIDFASKGYLSIYDSEDDTILTKLQDIPRSAAGFERSFFNALFAKGEEVSLHDLKKRHFGDNIAACKEMVFNHFHLKENRIYSSGSLTAQIFLAIFAGLVPALLSFSAVYLTTGMMELGVIPAVLIWPLISGSMVFWILLSRQAHAYSKGKKIGLTAAAVVCSIIAFSLSFFFIKNMIYLLLALIYVMAHIYMILTSGRRSDQGNRWLGQILGLKEFIETAEKERLEMLVEDNPSYFYSILPYAYVLGISDIWSNKFESINIQSPDWYSSYDSHTFTTILWMNHFHHTMYHLSSLSSAVTPPTSGSGGFSGGGGGGGFSGGGFGGGGGGSW